MISYTTLLVYILYYIAGVVVAAIVLNTVRVKGYELNDDFAAAMAIAWPGTLICLFSISVYCVLRVIWQPLVWLTGGEFNADRRADLIYHKNCDKPHTHVGGD